MILSDFVQKGGLFFNKVLLSLSHVILRICLVRCKHETPASRLLLELCVASLPFLLLSIFAETLADEPLRDTTFSAVVWLLLLRSFTLLSDGEVLVLLS